MNRSAGSPRSLLGSKTDNYENLASNLTLDERLVFLEHGSSDVPLSTQADILTVSRASLYYQPVAPSAQELTLKRAIDEAFTAHPFYGPRRITPIKPMPAASVRRPGYQP